MKKIIVITVLLSATILYGMELVKAEKGQTFMCPTFPNIFVVLDDIEKRNVDIRIVAMNERRAQLKNINDLWDGPYIGSLEIKLGLVETRKREHATKKMDKQFLFVTEPRIVREPVEKEEPLGDCQYTYSKAIKETGCCAGLSRMHKFIGNEAIEQMLQDADYCYTVVMLFAHKYFTRDDRARSIAFPELGGDFAYPVAHLAVASILRNSAKDQYKLIELVVPDLEKFNTYKDLLLYHQAEHLKKEKEKVV